MIHGLGVAFQCGHQVPQRCRLDHLIITFVRLTVKKLRAMNVMKKDMVVQLKIIVLTVKF